VKVVLTLRKFCRNFGLRKQHLGCDDGCRLMAVDIHCRILGTALCWNGRSDRLLHRFDVRLYEVRGLHYHCRAAVRGRYSDHKEHWTLQSDSDHKQLWTFAPCLKFIEIFTKSFVLICYNFFFWKERKTRSK